MDSDGQMQTDTSSFFPHPAGFTTITMPVSKENSHVSIKPEKHLRPALIQGVKAMHPSLQHLQDRKRHPDDWAQFPSACNHITAVQPRSFHRTPSAPTHAMEWAPKPLRRTNGALKQGHSQPSSACEGTLALLAHISTTVFPKFLHQPQKGVCPTVCSPEEKAQHLKSCHRVQSPTLTKVAPPSHTLHQFSVTPVNS